MEFFENLLGNQVLMSAVVGWVVAVSYTHLDVYKRQVFLC